MHRQTDNKIVLIIRKTRLEDIIARFNTQDQAQFYIERLGSDFSDYVLEDKTYKEAVATVQADLKTLGRVQTLDRSYLSNFMFGKQDIIVVVGQDGLVANTLKYLDSHPVVAINPDPQRWDGVLLPFQIQDTQPIIRDLLNRKRKHKDITFAKVELSDGQKLYGVNDLFIGPKSHSSARYVIKLGNDEEQHSSSGIIISTGLGSTGWLRSIVTGARGIIGPNSQDGHTQEDCSFEWSANYLRYSVREPFPSNITGTKLIFGNITATETMHITSLMANSGVIFSDGIESDFLEFNSGMNASIGVADRKGMLVV